MGSKKILVFLLSIVYCLLSTSLSAAPNFEIIWSNKSQETISLLRMVGIVNKEDWDSLAGDDKKILLLVFDDSGNLTAFGRRLLRELTSAGLRNPNRDIEKKIKAFDDLTVKARRTNQGLCKPGLGFEGAYQLAAEPFIGSSRRRSADDHPVVYAGMHDWSLPLPNDCFVDKRTAQEGKPPMERVRILVTPKMPVQKNRYNIHKEKNSEEITQEALQEVGIDSELLREHDARLVYTLNLPGVVNVISVEVPKAKAKSLALALQSQGHAAKPVTKIAMLTTPQSSGSSLPALVGASFQKVLESFQPALSESVDLLKPNKFYTAGFHGENAAAIIVDSSLDAQHPDFAGKQVVQRDFTEDNDSRDYVGHGSHVASTALGTGSASGGKYRGVAYGTQQVITAKVFGKSPFTSEDTIIAGIVWGIEQAAGKKAVINLSLGGPGDNEDALSRVVNNLAHQGHAVIVAAGNSGPRGGSVGSPGVARDALTVAATDKKGFITDYSSRGKESGYPTSSHKRVLYLKPDLSAPGGGVKMSLADRFLRHLKKYFDRSPEKGPPGIPLSSQGNCVYEDGIIAAKSSDSAKGSCDVLVKGKPLYTKMAGTSMATPHMTGANLLVYDYLERNGGIKETSFLESKAAQIEASRPLKKPNNEDYSFVEQGSGMPDLDRLYDLVESRVKLGLPIGNISAQIAFWMAANPKLRKEMTNYSSYRVTRFGIVSLTTGNVVNSDEELDRLAEKIEKEKKDEGFFRRWWRRWFGKESREDLLEK